MRHVAICSALFFAGFGICHAEGAAHPGTEASLHRFIEAVQKGEPNYDDMTPQLAGAARAQADRIVPSMQALGALKSLTFRTTGPQGMDIFDGVFEKGRAEFAIAPLTADGKVSARMWRIVP